uniref:Guanylate cyclase domain-containing protein n=1 Tax=viral metagenome TaxID=1070528 RepID=A0A6C0DAG0_9ZZZZ
MLFNLLYLFSYCIIDDLLKWFYLSNFDLITIDTYHINIQTNANFYYTLTTINRFILSIYTFYIFYYLFVSKMKNIDSLILAFIYFKYTLSMFFSNNISLFEYEYSRAVMWVFATPIMLKMYCETNYLKLKDIRFNYHYVPCVLNVIIYPFKNNLAIYYTYTGLSLVPIYLFMKRLVSLEKAKFTKIYCCIWLMFVLLHLVEITKLMNIYDVNTLFLTADMIGKVTTNFVVHDNREYDYNITHLTDLQCINFITYMLHKIKQYEKNNVKKTIECTSMIKYIINKLNDFIPENKEELQIELLKKILPFGLEKDYINNANENANANANENENANKHYDMICILFTDIVNYTELAKKYDDKIIFQLLNNVYIKFDSIIKKYSYLQKIETIGDAYMVVGDIYRRENNHKLVIEEIILLSFDFLNEIKTIKTPDNNVLSIRIGINMGNVSIGILGTEIPRLCVVGNAVNVAARLQSTADLNTIQMSTHIYEKLTEIDFDRPLHIKKKDNVFLKNIGSVTTYNITHP